jgi:hypothetical protein
VLDTLPQCAVARPSEVYGDDRWRCRDRSDYCPDAWRHFRRLRYLASVSTPLVPDGVSLLTTTGWCFWINLPLGGVTFAVILLLLKTPRKKASNAPPTLRVMLERFDLLGTTLLIPWVVCLLFALFWGGTLYPWSSWRIILLLCLFGVLFVAWAVVQVWEGDNATIPPRIVSQRSMACSLWLMFDIFSVLFILIYYVPIWFQTVKNESAYQSGIDLLAATAALSLTTIASGFLVSPTVACKLGGSILMVLMTDKQNRLLRSSNDCLQCLDVGRHWPDLHIQHQYQHRFLVSAAAH